MKKTERPYVWAVDMLRRVNLRPTCQRMGLVKLLFSGESRHICAEELYKEAKKNGLNLSLATVYNALNQFKESGLLREIMTGGDKAFFDTNLMPHFHVFFERDGRVEDVPDGQITVLLSDELRNNAAVKSIDVVVRV